MIDDAKRREKKLKGARLILRWRSLLLLIAFPLFVWSASDCFARPGVVTLLRLVGTTGGLLFVAGLVQQARGTLRNEGVEPWNVLVILGPLLAAAGPVMADMYRHGHLGVLYGTLAAVLLIVLLCGYILWLEARERRQKAG